MRISDSELCSIVPLFRDNCFPVVCWRHPGNGVVLLRAGASSRKRGSYFGAGDRNQEEVKLFQALATSNPKKGKSENS